jgi:hypothetical protein
MRRHPDILELRERIRWASRHYWCCPHQSRTHPSCSALHPEIISYSRQYYVAKTRDGDKEVSIIRCASRPHLCRQ